MNNDSLNRYLVLGSFSLFLIITGPSLFSEGMFLDGLMYAGIANNLANGLGDFWNLFYTKTVYAQFNEHPPLVFGIQALFFKVFGDGIWVERFYSLLTFLVVTIFTLKLWNLLSGSYRHAWVLVLFFAVIPLMTWSAANNILENTMSVFTISSGYFYFLAQIKRRKAYLLLSGIILCLAFLSKGFTGLFVWALPMAHLLVGTKNTRSFLLDTFLMVCGTCLFLMLLFFVFPDSEAALLRYFNRQVVGSLENIQTVKSRFYIVGKVVTELLIPLGLIVLLHLILRYKKIKLTTQKVNAVGISMLLVGLFGVFPIVISLKQSGFYILCTFPFLVIGISFLVKPALDVFHEHFLEPISSLKVIKGVVLSLASIALIISVFSSQLIGRDKERIAMVKEVLEKVAIDEVLQIEQHMMSDWSLHAYFCRYSHVSLSSDDLQQRYLLSDQKKEGSMVVNSGRYFLYLLPK